MRSYIPRILGEHIREGLNFTKVVIITGARQVGKTTLVKNESPMRSWTFISFDDLEALELAKKSPQELLSLSDHLVIDEVQKAPEFLSWVKKSVDENPSRRFVLTGSSHLLLMKKVSETLAGRAVYYELLPFIMSEINFKKLPFWLLQPEFLEKRRDKTIDLEFALFRGFLPPVYFLKEKRHIFKWWEGYVRTYLERDLRDLSRIDYLPDFRKLMSLCALRSANIFKQTELARDIGLPQTTVNRYLNLLEVSCLLVRVPSFTRNLAKRIIKSPKIFFIDPGLTCHLMGKADPKVIDEKSRSILFENFVFLNLYVFVTLHLGHIYYFRTYGGREKEVDFVLEIEGKIIGVEVKYSKNIGFSDAEGLRYLKEVCPDFKWGFIIYLDKEIKKLSANIYAVPWWYL